MVKKIALAVLGLVAVVAALGLVKFKQIEAMIAAGEAMQMPPESVSVAEVEEQIWVPSLRAVGTVRAARGVTVSAEVPGLVAKLAFDSGQKVQTGAVLIQLDASIERAELASAKATARLARVTLRRQSRLADQKINAPAERDTAQAEADQAAARVANILAQIAKKTIRAPFAGQLGIRQVDLGQIVSAGTPIVSLQDLETVFVDFFLPQQDLPRIARDQEVEIRVDAFVDRVWMGRIQSIEPSVDPSTRNVQVRAVLDNADGTLHPGMFVEAQVNLPAATPVIVVPATAVVYAPYGNSVYVVESNEPKGAAAAADQNGAASPEGAPPPQVPAMLARQVFVKLGERRGDFVVVRSGLDKGMQVVRAGAFKLRNGSPVVIDESDPVVPQVAPKPEDS